MTPATDLDLVVVDSDDLDERAARITARAFGMPFDLERHQSVRPLRRSAHCLIARRDGSDAGTGAAWDFRMSLPGTTTASVFGVTLVGVSLEHRRTGVLTAIMTELLDEAQRRGHSAAVLFASEAQIYGRFGFGAAAPRAKADVVAARSAYRPGTPTAPGRTRVLELDPPRSVPDSLAQAYEASWSRRPGEIARNQLNWDAMFARSAKTGKPDRLYLLREDAAGRPDGYVSYSVEEHWSTTGPAHLIDVQEIMAASDAVELDLWRSLFDHDLVAGVRAHVPVDWLVRDALADPWATEVRWDHHWLWARLLDVPRALTERVYRGSGEVVVDVLDPWRPEVAARYRLTIDDQGRAVCDRSTASPDLRMDVSVLSARWLGAGSFARAVRAGRVQELTAGAAVAADRCFGWDPAPYTTHQF